MQDITVRLRSYLIGNPSVNSFSVAKDALKEIEKLRGQVAEGTRLVLDSKTLDTPRYAIFGTNNDATLPVICSQQMEMFPASDSYMVEPSPIPRHFS